MNIKNATKAELVQLLNTKIEELASLRLENSQLRLQVEMSKAPKVEATKPAAPKSRVLKVQEKVYATAEEAKAAFNRIVEWAKTHEARVSISGCKVYVKTPA